MNKELLEVLEILEEEKNISKAMMLKAIKNSLPAVCRSYSGKMDNIRVNINTETYDFGVIVEREVAEEVKDPLMQISAAETKIMPPNYNVGDIVQTPIESKPFDRITAQSTKNVILQKIREGERKSLYSDWYGQERGIATGIVQRYLGRNLSINLGKVDAILNEVEQVKDEAFQLIERIKLYILKVEDTPKGPRISMSRTHPGLVKWLFESEVVKVRDGTVETKAIVREAGSKTKTVVMSHDANVDPAGACMGMNGTRVNSTVDELYGEKIDIITWNDSSAYLIRNVLDPAKVICVVVGENAKETRMIAPDYQLPLAIGKEDQNARLVARLAGCKINIKGETQARESGLLEKLGIQYQEEGVCEEHEGGYDAEYQEDYQGDYQGEYQSDYQDDSVTEQRDKSRK